MRLEWFWFLYWLFKALSRTCSLPAFLTLLLLNLGKENIDLIITPGDHSLTDLLCIRQPFLLLLLFVGSLLRQKAKKPTSDAFANLFSLAGTKLVYIQYCSIDRYHLLSNFK